MSRIYGGGDGFMDEKPDIRYPGARFNAIESSIIGRLYPRAVLKDRSFPILREMHEPEWIFQGSMAISRVKS